MKKNIQKISRIFFSTVMVLSLLSALSSTVLPVSVQAQTTNILSFPMQSLIICGESPAPAPGTAINLSDPHHPCQFSDLVQLVNNGISFLFYLSIPVTVVMLSIAGFRVIMAGDSEGELQKAKNLATNVVIGFVLLCGAWAIVSFVVTPFLNTGAGYTIFKL